MGLIKPDRLKGFLFFWIFFGLLYWVVVKSGQSFPEGDIKYWLLSLGLASWLSLTWGGESLSEKLRDMAGGLLLLAVLWSWAGKIGEHANKIAMTGMIAKAQVTNVFTCKEGRASVHYEFSVNGEVFRGSDFAPCEPALPSVIDIAYLPDKPKDSVILFDWRAKQRAEARK